MQLGPDCRIYMSSLSSTKSIHVINNPDEAAPFVILYNTISSYSLPLAQKSMPTFPNYRLDSGPVCDPTITTSSKDIADVPILSVKVFPIQPVPPFCGICLSIPKRRNKNRGYKWENQMAGTA